MTENRLGQNLYLYYSFKYLSEVRGVVDKAEEAVLYMKAFTVSQGWHLDFQAMDERRHLALSPDHPLRLIQPFLQVDGADLSMSDAKSTNEQETGSSHTVLRRGEHFKVVRLAANHITY